MQIYANILAGWSPILGIAADGTNRVQQVVGWTGGYGTAPSTGMYIGSNGYVANITDGVNIAGAGGGGGAALRGSGTYTQNSGTIQFSNQNGVTFGLTNNVMTASVAAQSVQTQGTFNTTQLGDYQLTANMSNYQTTGNYLTTAQPVGAYLTTARASNDAIGLNTALTANGVSVTANSSGLSLNFPAFLTTAQPVGAYLTTAALSDHSHNLATTTTNGSNIVVATANSVGATIGVPAFLTTAQPVGNYLTTARASNDAIGLNTAQSNVTWTVNSNGLSLDARGYAGTGVSATNATVTLDSNGIQISVNPGGVGGGAALKGSGTYTQNTGTVEFANSNGITFGLSNNGTMTASHNGLTTARASNDAVGLNTALTANGVAWTVNSSGISLNVPAFLTTAALSNHSHNFATTTTNGSLIVVATTNSAGATIAVPSFLTTAQAPGNYLTTARASNDAVGLNTALTANGVSWTVNSSGISLNVPAFLTTAAQSNHSHNFATTTTNGSVIVVATTNSAGATIAVPSFLTTARASTDAIGLNTAQSNVTWTVNSSGLSIDARGYAGTGTSATNASVTLNSNGLQISVANPGAGGGIAASLSGNSTSGGAGYSNITSGTMILAGGPNITLSQDGSRISISANNPGAAAENNWVNLLGANTAGNTTASGSTLGLSGINMTLSGTNASQIVMSVPATSSLSATGNFSISVNGSTISMGPIVPELYHWDNMGVNGAGVGGSSGTINVATNATKQNTVNIFPIGMIQGSIVANTMMLQMSHSASGNSSSAPKVFSVSFGLYTRNGSTLSLLNSASTAISLAANAANSTGFSGIRWIPFVGSQWSGGAAPTISADVEYYGAMVYSSGGNNSAAQTAGFLGFYPFMTANVSGVFGVSQTTASTQGFHPWIGVYSLTGTIPTNIQVADITKQGASANFVPHIVFNNLNSYY